MTNRALSLEGAEWVITAARRLKRARILERVVNDEGETSHLRSVDLFFEMCVAAVGSSVTGREIRQLNASESRPRLGYHIFTGRHTQPRPLVMPGR